MEHQEPNKSFIKLTLQNLNAFKSILEMETIRAISTFEVIFYKIFSTFALINKGLFNN